MQVLVLNNAYQPINVTTLIRGFNLVFKGKAEILEHIAEKPILTDRKKYRRPTVIRLLRYVAVPFRKVHLSRQNIFRRDDYKCIYCNKSGDAKSLTLDHVLPKSRGGANTWINLVSCCSSCNVTKGDKTPEEAGMIMSHEPFKPTYLYFVEKFKKVHESWNVYVGIVQ